MLQRPGKHATAHGVCGRPIDVARPFGGMVSQPLAGSKHEHDILREHRHDHHRRDRRAFLGSDAFRLENRHEITRQAIGRDMSGHDLQRMPGGEPRLVQNLQHAQRLGHDILGSREQYRVTDGVLVDVETPGCQVFSQPDSHLYRAHEAQGHLHEQILIGVRVAAPRQPGNSRRFSGSVAHEEQDSLVELDGNPPGRKNATTDQEKLSAGNSRTEAQVHRLLIGLNIRRQHDLEPQRSREHSLDESGERQAAQRGLRIRPREMSLDARRQGLRACRHGPHPCLQQEKHHDDV